MRHLRFAIAALLALAALAASAAPPAAAISDSEELRRFGGPGAGAGQLALSAGIGIDPITGHAFVAEQGTNRRISEFTPWGDFVKAFGWDVAPGAVNEQQEVRVRAATGEFKLTLGAESTADLPFDAEAAEVQAALEALSSIGPGDVGVSSVPGTVDGKTPFIHVIAFKGSLAGSDASQLVAADGTTPLDGGVPTTSLEVRTRAEGHAETAGLESCTAESGCKAGLVGSGAGQLAENARGVAVDAAGNVYLREAENRRVQKFDSAGRFVLMFGGEVNKTTSANICTAASGNTCGAGAAGVGNGQFGEGSATGIAFGPGGKLFAGDVERIQRFDTEGKWEASIPTAKTVHDLAIPPGGGDFYATVGPFSGTEENVRILDATTGAEKAKLQAAELENSKGNPVPATKATEGPIATDLTGNVFFRRNNLSLEVEGELANPVLQFDAEGKQTSEFGASLLPATAKGLATNALGNLYVSSSDNFLTVFGPPPVTFEGAPPLAPTILTQFAGPVGREEATLGAEINPHFWSDTRYYVQYGTGKCSAGGCPEEAPPAPGLFLTTKAQDATLRSAGISLSGLEPNTTYNYRFVAESNGGGPAFGIDPDGEGPEEASAEAGLEASFTTFPEPPPVKSDCPNQKFRTGTSAPLPDCRAYEMVSPLDKNNGDIRALFDLPSYPTALTQSSTEGNRFTYSSFRGFGDLQAAPYTNQYMATRKDGVGWSSEALSPPETAGFTSNSLENRYKAFTADLCLGWAITRAEPVLAPGVPPGYAWPYRRENCGGGGFEAVIDEVEPTVEKKGSFFPLLQGASADGGEVAFIVQDRLTEEAASGIWQAYYASEAGEGEPQLLCIGPKGTASGGSCSAGTGPSPESGGVGFVLRERYSSLTHAISADGAKVYWTDSRGIPAGPGKVYLRENPGLPESASKDGEGNCVPEAEAACTVEVSETITADPSRFLGASSDGAKALFEVTAGTLADDLYRFDAQSGGSTLIAGEVLGVAGMSEDLSRVYFISEEDLGGDALAGEPNLYLEEEGTKTFIATLSGIDTNDGKSPNDAGPRPIFHAARATPDGRVLAFISNKSLTGYDNKDLLSGKANSEAYLYEAGAAEPVCVSCNPSGARPAGRMMELPHFAEPGLQTAAWLPLPDNSLDNPRFLSEDGGRLFFNSFDALLPGDTNGKADVYQWQAASGQKECDEQGAELFVPASGGCLSLISTGQSPQDSELLEISANGADAFFTTNASLLPQDPGLIDVYDARANGGLPAPPEPPGPCQGEACQFATPPPTDPTPASASFRGAGNPSVDKPRPRCGKGKARRKGRCAAKRKASRKAAKRKRATEGHNGKRARTSGPSR